MADKPDAQIAAVLAEARITLDQALERIRSGEAVGALSAASLQRLSAAEDNTSCQNTGCTTRPRAAASSAG